MGVQEALLELAEADEELMVLERSRRELPGRLALSALEEQARALAGRFADLEVERGPLAVRLAELEDEVRGIHERRALVEGRLASATGAGRELVAMDEERQHLAERESGLEDLELELMEQLEPLDAALAVLEAERAELAGAATAARGQLEGEEAELDGRIVERRAQRSTAAAACEPSLLDRYERITAKLGAPGAARLAQGRCGGCHLALAAAEVEAQRSLGPDEVGSCESCGRLLLRVEA